MSGERKYASTSVSYERIVTYLLAMAMVLLAILAMGASIQSSEFEARRSLLWESARGDWGVPTIDTDGDGLPDIEENYVYGTNPYRVDTDDDGMGDNWEVRWRERDPLTEQMLIDPVDPTDAYEDPDNDGYDYDHNGAIDRYDDMVALTALKIPPGATFEERSIRRLVQNPPLYAGTLVHLTGVHVMDNATYAAGAGHEVERDVVIDVADGPDDTARDWLRVVMQPNSNRPVELDAWNMTSTGQSVPGSRVDVQGVFMVQGPSSWVAVRGGEGFTNIMEYRARFYLGDPSIPEANRQRHRR
jgi:hypothetical protein